MNQKAEREEVRWSERQGAQQVQKRVRELLAKDARQNAANFRCDIPKHNWL